MRRCTFFKNWCKKANILLTQLKKRRLCDCSGSYCKYCWLGVFPCTWPYVWYKFAKALDMGIWVKIVLAVSILSAVFIILFNAISYPDLYYQPRVSSTYYITQLLSTYIIQCVTQKCHTFFKKVPWKSVTLWEHLPKMYYFWTIYIYYSYNKTKK